jgi:GT2 family glycosyltransferase
VNEITVIILTLNQRERTLACLASLLAISQPGFDILVWDNGSDDGTEPAIKERYPQVMVHRSGTNLGVAGGRNAAARLAIDTFNPTFLLFLDNDMLVEDEFVTGLHQPLLDDERVGQTQAKLRFMDRRDYLNDGGGARINFITWQVTPVGFGEVDRGQYDQVTPCISCGGAMMVRTELFQELGGFDEVFSPFGPEDLDFSLRLQKAGYQSLYAPQAVAYHVVSHTFGEGYSEEYARHKSRHWFTFMRRHATPVEKLGFFLIGLPYLTGRVILREGRRGNIKAIRGLAQGVLEYSKGILLTRKAQ